MKSEIRNKISLLKKSHKKRIIPLSFLKLHINKATNIFVYMSKKDEVNTSNIIAFLLENKKKVFIPFIKNDELYFSEYESLDDLQDGSFGILESKQKIPSNINPDVIIVPGVAFDRKGNRLGRGKGYYDRFLKNKSCLKIGLAFDFQVLDNIPVQKWDISMDIVITEKEVINCRKNR